MVSLMSSFGIQFVIRIVKAIKKQTLQMKASLERNSSQRMKKFKV